ncbi:hypothetical protein GMOD_00004116 [Pyrenophora seminiperda CCB06]|uniref:Uncharacterized protein n=1 Tax=Pyrenophora seminiperda CCB06 TaxID=1302712 RepID=A0A3M7M0R9_9PLEO|nr:hypothetical protein GMOD_00004116 [Pyrenophora seminiperda CCB06]
MGMWIAYGPKVWFSLLLLLWEWQRAVRVMITTRMNSARLGPPLNIYTAYTVISPTCYAVK